MGQIITFYSYKGGTGRTMALANVAIVLVQMGYRVLIVDWDLEAPGLENFFKDFLNLEEVTQQRGIIELLSNAFEGTLQTPEKFDWRNYLSRIEIPAGKEPLHLLTAGMRNAEYINKVRNFDIQTFYSERRGGDFIETLRNEWKQAYDYILVDSRTGITDSGGICTVQLPDVLVLLFTATEQALKGVIDVAKKVERARQKLPFDRLSLVSVPIPSRFDDRAEFDVSEEWLSRFATELSELYVNWLPTSADIREFLQITKIPYISYFSFGEKLPVLEQGKIDPAGLGFAYETLAALIAHSLGGVEELLKNRDAFVRSAQKPAPENLEFLRFANREDELRTICAPGKPLLLIDAPACYGKTYILEEVRRRLEPEWICVIIRLEQCQGKRAIRSEIASQIKALNLPIGKEQDADNLLKRALADAGKIILMFDSIERATKEDREWILDDFALNCVGSIPGTRFRVFVAGRYASVNFSSILRRYETISLTPFSQKVVEEVLVDALRVMSPSFDVEKERLQSWSRYILRLSGGHPRFIQRLVTDLAKEKHWFINFHREEVNLFKTYVASEIDLIVGDLDDQMKQALEVLSVFRIFNFNVVQALQKALLPEHINFPRDMEPRVIVNKLAQYGLVEKDKNGVFYSGKIVGNLVLARIRISFPQKYRELNRLARAIYDTWIEQLQKQEPYGPVDPQVYLGIFVKESIYHFCQSFIGDDKLTEVELSACLRRHSGYLVQGLGEDKRDPHYRMKLEGIIAADEEIRQALEERNLDFQTLWKIAFPTNSSNFTKSKVDSVIQQGGSLVNSNEVGKNDADQVIPRKLRVFLSHASQDKLLAHELYNQLAVENWLDPWLDEENLLPGQDWQLEIEKAMETADAVIVCLSSESVSKDGYVQRELKYVIDIALEKPEGTIFIIPLRLDDCQIPRRVRSIQWMDYFPKEYRTEALRKILRSLEERRKKLGI